MFFDSVIKFNKRFIDNFNIITELHILKFQIKSNIFFH